MCVTTFSIYQHHSRRQQHRHHHQIRPSLLAGGFGTTATHDSSDLCGFVETKSCTMQAAEEKAQSTKKRMADMQSSLDSQRKAR